MNRVQIGLFCCFALVMAMCFGCQNNEQQNAVRSDVSIVPAQKNKIAAPEKKEVVFGQIHQIESESLGETRTLNILLPPGYKDQAEATFPVIYLLDGAENEDYFHVAGLVQFLTMYQLMPASILVGIANIDRYRDFTFPSDVAEDIKRLPTSGGSEKFRQFLAAELKPYVENNFRTTGETTLIGQSLGGLLATEVFIKTPDLFSQYLIVSPSLWWNQFSLANQLNKSIENMALKQKKVVVIALGDEGPEMKQGVDLFTDALSDHASAQLEWHFEAFPKETHATILHRAVYAGFERLYEKTHKGF